MEADKNTPNFQNSTSNNFCCQFKAMSSSTCPSFRENTQLTSDIQSMSKHMFSRLISCEQLKTGPNSSSLSGAKESKRLW